MTGDETRLMMTRRSIRKYTDQPVSDAEVEALLRAAMAAPSAMNLQPWTFVVLKDREHLDGVTAFHPHGAMIREAPLAICVCGDSSIQPREGYWVQDCSAATQNLLLAAHALGLGAVWLGIHPREERIAGMRAHLDLPDRIKPLSLVVVGRPAETKEPSARYDPGRIHQERW